MSGLILSDVLRMCLCIQYYPMPFPSVLSGSPGPAFYWGNLYVRTAMTVT